MVEIKATEACLAKLRESLSIYEAGMDIPVVRTIAKQHWGEHVPEGAPYPPWLHECRQCLSYGMRQFMTEEAAWDAFTMNEIIKSHLSIFVPVAMRGDDAASEMHRSLDRRLICRVPDSCPVVVRAGIESTKSRMCVIHWPTTISRASMRL